MQGQPTQELDQIPLSTVRRWAMKAAAVGLLLGAFAGTAALLTQ